MRRQALRKAPPMLAFYLSLIDQPDDRKRFEELYYEYRSLMLAVAVRILRDRCLAEDAVHDAFLCILENLSKLPPMDCNKTRSYFVLIVKSISLDQLRLQKRRRETLLPEYGEDVWDDKTEPIQVIVGQEDAADVHAALRHLKQPYLDILVLKLIYGFKCREIARMLRMPESTVRVYLYRGRKQLIRRLEVDPNEDPAHS